MDIASFFKKPAAAKPPAEVEAKPSKAKQNVEGGITSFFKKPVADKHAAVDDENARHLQEENGGSTTAVEQKNVLDSIAVEKKAEHEASSPTACQSTAATTKDERSTKDIEIEEEEVEEDEEDDEPPLAIFGGSMASPPDTVWVQYDEYPWWPAKIAADPETGQWRKDGRNPTVRKH